MLTVKNQISNIAKATLCDVTNKHIATRHKKIKSQIKLHFKTF